MTSDRIRSKAIVVIIPKIVWSEENFRSLKAAVADIVQYIGPWATVTDIIMKMDSVDGTLASFNVLMQAFYRLQQGKR